MTVPSSQDVQLVVLVAGTLVPVVTGLITAHDTSEVYQTAISAALSVAVGLVSTWSCTGTLNWVTAAVAVATTFIMAMIAADHIYKPTGATKKLQELVPALHLGAATYGGTDLSKPSKSSITPPS
jgi:uncharacterized membrane protein (DUF441 family)